MPRVHFVRAARKENPVAKVGESYYWWKFRYGGKQFSKTRPRPSQLTQSPFRSGYAAAREAFEDALITDQDSFESARDELAQAYRDLGDEMQGNRDNMPDQLQESETGEMLQTRADGMEELATQVEAVEWDDSIADGMGEDGLQDYCADLVSEVLDLEFDE